MKLEYLPTGAEACPLLRLFDYNANEIERLREVCRDLAVGAISEFALHDQPWIIPVTGEKFTWLEDANDYGVRLPTTDLKFILTYSAEAWLEVASKLELVAKKICGFNWQTMEGDVNVLISWDGRW